MLPQWHHIRHPTRRWRRPAIRLRRALGTASVTALHSVQPLATLSYSFAQSPSSVAKNRLHAVATLVGIPDFLIDIHLLPKGCATSRRIAPRGRRQLASSIQPKTAVSPHIAPLGGLAAQPSFDIEKGCPERNSDQKIHQDESRRRLRSQPYLVRLARCGPHESPRTT